MNRTALFLAVAVGLLLTAVVVGFPKTGAKPPAPTVAQPTPPTPEPQPPPPVEVTKPAPVGVPGSLTMTGKLSHPYIVPGTNDVFVTLDVTGVTVPGAKRSPVSLALVIDRSGSMSGQKLANAKRAANRLIDLLEEGDHLAIVHYGTEANVMVGRFATEDNKRAMHRYVNAIEENGGTNIGEALQLGRAQLMKMKTDFRVNRLLLLSDGQPTVGITSSGALLNIVAKMRTEGISTTSLGVGADFNQQLMQGLADNGGGSFGFAGTGDGQQLLTTFEKDLSQAGTMIARGVNITFPIAPGVSFSEVYGRQVSVGGDSVTVTLPDFSAGQTERIVIHLNKRAANLGTDVIGDFKLAYEDLLSEKAANSSVMLSAYVVNDRQQMASNIDKEAYVSGKKAQAKVNYDKAAEALENGDTGSAQVALQRNEVLFDDAKDIAGEGAVSDARRANKQAYGLTTTPAAPEMRREQAKSLNVEGLRSSGRGASLY